MAMTKTRTADARPRSLERAPAPGPPQSLDFLEQVERERSPGQVHAKVLLQAHHSVHAR